MLELPGTLSWKLFPLEGKRRKEQKACLLHSDEGRMNKLWLQPAARTVTILVLLSRFLLLCFSPRLLLLLPAAWTLWMVLKLNTFLSGFL